MPTRLEKQLPKLSAIRNSFIYKNNFYEINVLKLINKMIIVCRLQCEIMFPFNYFKYFFHSSSLNKSTNFTEKSPSFLSLLLLNFLHNTSPNIFYLIKRTTFTRRKYSLNKITVIFIYFYHLIFFIIQCFLISLNCANRSSFHHKFGRYVYKGSSNQFILL